MISLKQMAADRMSRRRAKEALAKTAAKSRDVFRRDAEPPKTLFYGTLVSNGKRDDDR